MVTRNIKYGNDFFKTLEKSNPNIFFEITYWDVWIAILLNNHFDNKWDDLINSFPSQKKWEQENGNE